MTDRTIYISNVSRSHDYESAKKFGTLRPVTSGNYPIFKTIRLQEEIINALVYSKPDDYLLLSGSSVVAGMCMLIWELIHGKVNVLLFDRKEKSYVLRKFSRDNVLKEIERTRDQLQIEGD